VTVSDTGELRFDRDAGVLVVDTPRSQAVIGMAGGRRVETGDVVFELDNPFAVVTVSSLTEAPIAASERLLVTTVARAQNTGFQFTVEQRRHVIRAHGQGPVMAEAVTGRLTFGGAGGPYRVRPDAHRGTPRSGCNHRGGRRNSHRSDGLRPSPALRGHPRLNTGGFSCILISLTRRTKAGFELDVVRRCRVARLGLWPWPLRRSSLLRR
jgi:hypothetical protein